MKIIAFVFVLLFANSAQADWQFTKWGMTVEEVLASNKQVTRLLPEGIKKHSHDGTTAALGIPEYKSGNYEFTAIFHFGKASNKLEKIVLKSVRPTLSQMIDIVNSLRGKYGLEFEKDRRYSSDTAISTSEWLGDTMHIKLFSRGSIPMSDLTITYTPRLDENNSGL